MHSAGSESRMCKMSADAATASPSIPRRPRPLFDGLATDEEKFAAATAEYEALKDADADGLDFANKTAMWIAFERDVESRRPDRLFRDPLAGRLSEPYGRRLSDAMSFGLAFSCFDPPGEDAGFGLEGHVMYTAARTKLINDQMEDWLRDAADAGGDCQVVNLGAGVDTRVYWVEGLKRSKAYWEVDTASVLDYKQRILDGLKEKGELPDPFCERRTVRMEFSKDPITDLPAKHGYDAATPTCWVLEGLVMYLERRDVERLLDHASILSASRSLLILNFYVGEKGVGIDEMRERLEGRGWTETARLMFGDEGFDFGRYPPGKPANKQLGMAVYEKA